MSRDYWDRVKQTLSSFWKPGDELRCIRIYTQEGSTCQMCGHKGMKWNHVLRNMRTGSDLVVGSECINNHKVVTGKHVVLPERYKRVADYLNSRYPNCVVVASESLPVPILWRADMQVREQGSATPRRNNFCASWLAEPPRPG